ncbi:MAG: Do family serine endopeptidase [Bacteroidia bacterium]|nr:Do family serine endopeptidase [Bacteroidia bacterium]
MAMKKILIVFAAALAGGAVSLGIYDLWKGDQKGSETGKYEGIRQTGYYVNLPGNTAAPDFVAAADLSVHAVVHVNTTVEHPETSYNEMNPFHDFFWGNPFQPRGPSVASGSGVIVSGDGYIVTNNHVVNGADKIEITLNDKRTYTAELIGTDPSTDLALLKIKEKDLPYLLYGNSDNCKVGEWVLAVGNPFNLTSTVTAGIVSAKGRNINIIEGNPEKGMFPVESFIQTDAAINPGNSGGALVNVKGELVGINTAIASNTGSYAGYGFAIPVNLVRKVVNDLLEFGQVQRAFLGVSIRDIDSRLKEEKSLKDMKGVYVNGLTEGGGADKAGIKEGDIIIRVGDAPVNNTAELMEQVSRFRPGDKVTVTLRRDAKEVTLPVVLKNRKNETKLLEKMDVEESVKLLGATFENISDAEKKKLGIESGLKIVEMEGGKLRSAGIKEGFIITSIDKKKVNSLDDLKKALENKKGGVLIEGVYANGMRAYYAFGL